MLRIGAKSAAGGPAIPKSFTSLSVSWLNEQFKAVSVEKGVIQNSWEQSGLKDGAANFEEFIREAIRETGYAGQSISVVLAHPRLVQQMVEVPPVKAATFKKLVQRQALQQKIFPGEAAWTSQNLPPNKGHLRVLLHLLPKPILNQLTVACRRNGLHLTSVLPVSAVLEQQLTALALDKADIAMLAAETGGSTTVVVGGYAGRLLLSRTLQGSWKQDPARLAVDLSRTLLFASQQFGVTVNKGIWLFGPGAAEAIASLQSQLQFPVQLSPVENQPFHWASTAPKLVEDGPNFISEELQKAPQRRVFAKVIVAGTTVLLTGSIALTAYSLIQSRKEMTTLDSCAAQTTRMQARQRVLEQRDTEMKRKQETIRVVMGDRPPPTPAWLLAYMGEAVPPDLVVTNFSIKRVADHYQVKLTGVAQPAIKSPSAPLLTDSIATLKARLADKPFYLQVLETNAANQTARPAKDGAKPGAARTPVAEWLNRVTTKILPAKPVGQDQPDHFVIEGVLR